MWADVLNVNALEAIARERVTELAWDYYSSGADDEHCVRKNCAAFAKYELHHRVLVDVSRRELATTVLGERIAMPIAVAPTAFHRLAHDDGELATVRGAGDAGTLFILSTLSNTAIEDVVAAATGPVWFQLYVYKDRGATQALVHRAEAAGARALVVTVDAPLLGRRERDVRNKFALPAGLSVRNMFAEAGEVTAPSGDSGLAAYFATLLDPALTWDAIAWLRSITKLPVIVKGIVRADDAARAVDVGAAGIVVSNHGGRQLDSSPPTIDVLARVVDAACGRCEILLAAGGREGVAHVLAMLRRELDLAMALAGCPTIAAITRDLIAP
jgi:4-hydroxymandelate oxidase